MALPLNSSVSHVANLSPVLEGNDPDNSVHPSKKFAIRSTDCDQIADILDKVANTQQNQTQVSDCYRRGQIKSFLTTHA